MYGGHCLFLNVSYVYVCMFVFQNVDDYWYLSERTNELWNWIAFKLCFKQYVLECEEYYPPITSVAIPQVYNGKPAKPKEFPHMVRSAFLKM